MFEFGNFVKLVINFLTLPRFYAMYKIANVLVSRQKKIINLCSNLLGLLNVSYLDINFYKFFQTFHFQSHFVT